MKSYKKSQQELAIMQECGARLKHATQELMLSVKSGITTFELDLVAAELLKKNGLEVSFKTVDNYKYATCLPVNNQAVHTEPSGYILMPGDVLTIDIGGLFKGYHADWATTLIVDNLKKPKVESFLDAGKKALSLSINAFKPGIYIGEIGQIMQKTIESAGYRVLKDLTGHGIGRELHEDPYIYNYSKGNVTKTYKVEEGFVCAIEIIYSETCEKIIQPSAAEWTINTADGSLAACFEHTVMATKNGVHILT